MITLHFKKKVHGNLEYSMLSNLGEGTLYETWTVNHGKENAQHRNHISYFQTTQEADENIIRRAARMLDSGWLIQ